MLAFAERCTSRLHHQPGRLGDFTVRRAERDERALLSHLHLAALWCLEMEGHLVTTIEAWAQRIAAIDDALIARGAYFVAERNGAVVGGAGWSPLADDLRSVTFLDERGWPASLDASPRAALLRGAFDDTQGGCRVGMRQLLDRVGQDAQDCGFTALETFVPEPSLAAYRAVDFRPVRRLGLVLGDSGLLPVVQVRRPLPDLAAAA